MVLSVATEKSLATPLGIDFETFRLVAQCLNHYAIPGPEILVSEFIFVYERVKLCVVYYGYCCIT